MKRMSFIVTMLAALILTAGNAMAYYQVTASAEAKGPIRIDMDVLYASGDTHIVSPEVIDWYTGRTDVFTVTEVTATGAEVNAINDGGWASFTTTATPASGSVGVQFVFKDANGTTMAVPTAGTFYISEVATGLTRDPADTGVAVLTNGAVKNLDAATHNGWEYTTTAAGLLGITITAAADDYYVVFVKPNGTLAISTVCTVN